MSNPTEDKNVV